MSCHTPRWNRALTLAPPNHLMSAGTCTTAFSASSPSRSFLSPPPPSMYCSRGTLWILVCFHLCCRTRPEMLPKTDRAALNTVSRYLRRSDRVEVGDVTPRSLACSGP